MNGVDSTRIDSRSKDFCGRPARRSETRLINLSAAGGIGDLRVRMGRDERTVATATFTAPPIHLVSSIHIDSSKGGHPEKRDGNSVCVDDDIPATDMAGTPSILTPIAYALRVPVTVVLDSATAGRSQRIDRTTRDTIPVSEHDPVVRTVAWRLERKPMRAPRR
jgi:hypothetical protein